MDDIHTHTLNSLHTMPVSKMRRVIEQCRQSPIASPRNESALSWQGTERERRYVDATTEIGNTS
jgi:hypothetical protein